MPVVTGYEKNEVLLLAIILLGIIVVLIIGVVNFLIDGYIFQH